MKLRREAASGLEPGSAAPSSLFPTDGFILSETGAGLRLFRQPLCHWALTRDNWRTSLSQAEGARAEGAWLYLALGYELGTLWEPRAAHLPGPEDGILGHLWAFPEPLPLDETAFAQALADHRARLPEARRYPGIADLHPELDEAAYTRAIQAIHAYIRAGTATRSISPFPSISIATGIPCCFTPPCVSASPALWGRWWPCRK